MNKLILFTIGILASGSAQAVDYIVKFKSEAGLARTMSMDKSIQAQVKDMIPQLSAVVVDGKVLQQKSFGALSSEIEYIETNDQVHIVSGSKPTPAAELSGLWGMGTIHTKEAWESSRGNGVVVAVSDTGVWASHNELETQLHKNPGETGVDAQGKNKSSNGIDDDGNGYVDDVMGWNFVSNKPATSDNHYHGTHVSGTIAAAQNGFGIAGVAPDAKIMNVAFLDSQGSGTEANGAKSIMYAADNGARIVSCSWGGEGDSQIIADAITYAQSKGVLVIAAAGNDSANTDKEIHSPSALPNENIIAVGATESSNNGVAFFSNYGATTVDLAAPGHKIKSTVNTNLKPGKLYEELSGTSMATPHVSGVAALVWSLRPNLNWRQVKEILMKSTESAKAWSGKSVTGGVLRADKAVELAKTY